MRFDSPSSSPPPLATPWRMILWAATLAPALLILTWSLRQARLPKPDPALAGRTAEEAQRLKDVLSGPQDHRPSPLRDDSVRVVEPAQNPPIGRTVEPPAQQNDARLDKSILANVNDNTFGVTSAEKAAYDATLIKARDVPLEDLERIAHRDVPFAVLMLEVDRYRGEVLTVEGDMRRLNRLDSAEEPSEVGRTYEAWLFTADSGLNPYRVILTNVPHGFDAGDNFQPPPRVRVTGYFFKRYSYATANNYHTAPLLLAPTLTLLPASASPARPPTPQRSQWLTIAVLSLLGLFIAIGFVSIAKPRRRRGAKPTEPLPEPDWEAFQQPRD